MLTWMPAWKPPPKSTGSLSGCRCAQVVRMRSREVIDRLVHQLLLDLLQALAFGLRQLEFEEHKAEGTDPGVNPEGDSRAEARPEHREGLGEHETDAHDHKEHGERGVAK